MSLMRTFLAIELPKTLQRRAAALMSQFTRQGVRIRWTEDDNLHLTLCFLGDIEDRRIPDACQAIESVTANTPAIEIEAQGVGAFPQTRRPRVVWMGVAAGSEALVATQRELRMALEDRSFVMDRGKYRPHITLGRVPGGHDTTLLSSLLENFDDWEGQRWVADQMTLFSSHRERSGPPIYTPLAHFELG